MDIVFQGFQSVFPPWVYIALLFITTGLSWWSYKDKKGIKTFYRSLLITLRSLTFFILVILLMNPIFRSESTYYEKPVILTVLDNSASVTLEKSNYQGVDSYRESMAQSGITDTGTVQFDYYSFGQNVSPVSPESLTFDDTGTNLQRVMETIKNRESEARAAVIFTDGIYNGGNNPSFTTNEIEIPVFTVGLGDTARMKDLVVREVRSDNSGYLNTNHSVDATLLNRGFSGTSFQVQLKSADEIIDTQTITPNNDESSHTVTFQFELDEEGLRQYTVAVPVKEGEFTVANNSAPFSVEVLDDMQQILHVAFEVHPDVKAVRSVLESDKNINLTSYTWISGARFLNGPIRVGPDSLDLVILHGYPDNGVPSSLADKVDTILNEVPSLIFTLPQSNLSDIPGSGQLLPIRHIPNARRVNIQLSPAADQNDHPVMELPQVTYNLLPAIQAPASSTDSYAGSTILFTGRFQGTETGHPVVSVRELGNYRRALVNGHGWYKLAQSSNSQVRSFTETLFQNLISWTAAEPDNRRLQIQPEQDVYSINDNIQFSAFLTNESGNVESEGVIDVTISGPQIDSRIFTMNNRGNGQYRLNVGSFPKGVYRYEAVAQKGERTIDEQQGEFSVSESNREFVNTIQNRSLLTQVSGITEGAYFSYRDTDQLRDTMEQRGLLDRQEKVREELFYPYRHLFWFLLVILLLGAEWIIRKYLALP